MAIRLTGKFSPFGLRGETLLAVLALADFLRTDCEYKGDIWLTSGSDGVHSTASRHYLGLGFDADLVGPQADALLDKCGKELRQYLAPRYDVLRHKSHLHIEYDPQLSA